MWNFGGWAASLDADSVGGSSDNNTSTSAHVLVFLSVRHQWLADQPDVRMCGIVAA